MRVVILTSNHNGLASRCIPVLAESPEIELAGVVLVHHAFARKSQKYKRKIRKIIKIGPLGAIAGLWMRSWYADTAPDIREVCDSSGIQIWDSPTANCATTRSLIKDSGAELGLSLGNSYIARSVYSIPVNGMVNVHMERLPRYRGAQSILWPIHNMETDTGFSIHQIDRTIDAGAILLQQKYPIDFRPTLKDTVVATLDYGRRLVPHALRDVCEQYLELQKTASPQTKGEVFTTPTARQFLRMMSNHRKLRNSAT